MAIVDYYVSPANGSDSTGLGTLARPWKSTQKALNTIVRNASGGDRINLQHGAADALAAPLSLATYGTPSVTAPLIFQGYTAVAGDGGIGELDGGGLVSIATGVGNFITFRCLKLGNCGASAVLIFTGLALADNCEIYGSTATLSLNLAAASTLRNCYLHDLAGSSSVGIAYDCLVDQRSSSAGAGKIALQAHGTARGNRILCNNAMTGLGVYGGATAENNSVWSSHGAGVGIALASSGMDIVNNIVEGFSGSGGDGFQATAGTDCRILAGNRVYNCVTPYAATAEFDDGTNLVLTASPFVSPSTGDLTLNVDPNGGALCGGRFSYPAGFQGGPRTQWRAIGAIQPLATIPTAIAGAARHGPRYPAAANAAARFGAVPKVAPKLAGETNQW